MLARAESYSVGGETVQTGIANSLVGFMGGATFSLWFALPFFGPLTLAGGVLYGVAAGVLQYRNLDAARTQDDLLHLIARLTRKYENIEGRMDLEDLREYCSIKYQAVKAGGVAARLFADLDNALDSRGAF